MPNFNFLKAFNKGQSKNRRARAAPPEAVQTYQIHPEHSSSSTSSRSQKSPPAPVEIIKSQPITDPTFDGRGGSIKRRNKLHRHRHSEDTTHNAWPTDAQHTLPHNAYLIPPGRGTPPPPSLHPIPAPEQPLNKHVSSIYPDEYPYPYDDNHHRRLQSQTDEPIPGGMPGFHEDPYHEVPRGTHEPKSIRHRGHQSIPFPQYGELDGPPLTTNQTHSSHGSHHTSRGHVHSHGHGHGHGLERSRGRAGSWTQIPAVHREADGHPEGLLYADHPNPGVHFEDAGARLHRHHSVQAPGTIEGHHSHGRTGWIPENKLDERVNDPDAIPILNSESHLHHVEQHQHVYPPVDQPHHHPRSPGLHDPLPRHGIPDPTGLHGHHGRSVSHSSNKAPHEGILPKVFMFNDYHASEKEPGAHRDRSVHRDSSDTEPEEYRYIVPFGRRVVFKDRHGKEITRIGYSGPIPQGHSDDMVPFTVIDEVGNILFRHRGLESSRRRHRDRDHLSGSGDSHRGRRIKVIMIDEHGNQVPMKTGTIPHSSRSRHSGHSKRRHHHQQPV